MKHIYCVLYTLLFFVLGFLFFKYTTYNFIQQEEFQLFIVSFNNITSILSKPGGFIELCGLLTTQFYVYPMFGAVSNALIITLCAVLCHLSLRQVTERWMAFGGSLIISLYLLEYHSELCYAIDGTYGILLMLVCLNSMLRLSENRRFILISALSLIIMFWLTGQLVILYAILLAVLLGLKKHSDYKSYAVILASGALLFAIALFGFDQIPLSKGFKSITYHENQLNIYSYLYYVWINFTMLYMLAAIVLCVIAERLSGKARVIAALFVLSVGVCTLVIKNIPSKEKTFSRMTFYLNHLTGQERWDDVIRFHAGRPRYSAYNNTCLNYALARKGELADKMFRYYQQGLSGLFPAFDKKYFTNVLLSEIFLATGCPNTSESYATEELTTARRYSNPRILKDIILADEMKGEYALADKYLDIMSKAPMYAEWAKNKKAEMKRTPKHINNADSLLSMTDMEALLTESIRDNKNKTAWEYLGAAYLLGREKDKFYKFITEQTPEEFLNPMPTHFQEAILIFFEEKQIDERIKIDESVKNRFADFKKLLERKDMNTLYREYKNTYWTYAMNTGLK